MVLGTLLADSVAMLANPVAELPPPPAEPVEIDVSSRPTFNPYEVAPEITNRTQVQQALVREHPTRLSLAREGPRFNPGMPTNALSDSIATLPTRSTRPWSCAQPPASPGWKDRQDPRP